MSFTSDYLSALEKKKKKKTGDSFTDEYAAFLSDYRDDQEDIAPVQQLQEPHGTLIAQFETKHAEMEGEAAFSALLSQDTTQRVSDPYQAFLYDYQDLTPSQIAQDPEVQKKMIYDKALVTPEERTWFDAGAFDDGYQFGDVFRTINATSDNVSNNIMAGILGIGEKVVDAGAYVAGGVGGLFGADNFKESMTEFIADDLYDEAEVAKRLMNIGNPIYSNFTKKVTDIEEDDSVLGEKSESVIQSAGQLMATAALQGVGVPWWVTTGTTTFGSETENAFNQGATYTEAGISAAITAGAEVLTERISGGISFGGATLDDALTKSLSRNISSKVARTFAKVGMDVAGEGLEEVVSEFCSTLGKQLTYEKEETWKEILTNEAAMDAYIAQVGESLFGEEAWESYKEAFIGGAALGGFGSVVNAGKSAVNGVDAVSGLTANEESVVNKIWEDRIAEDEKGGKKLTNAEKNKIYDEIIESLNRGEISIDTIESVLGGDNYKAYLDTVNNEDALIKEYNELGKTQNPTLAEQSRFRELESQIKDIKENSQRGELKNQLSKSVYDSLLTKNKFGNVVDGRLAESYHEQARRGVAFETDLSKVDEKYQETYKRAAESGILNNTRRTHEFVDMIAKISADKGVLFDFTNNAKLKESGFAVDGKTVNGFVTKDGVTVNIDSAKSLNSVVGHEITHVLEGTEFYAELQKAITEYAKIKGDYQGRYDALSKLYGGVEGANIDAELTADLVGDYLFTDKDFIANLSTKHRNVFQKIYDELKYLLKVAKAGSKEARALEQVKKTFAEAYKSESKAQSDTKYSMSESGVKHGDAAYSTFGTTSNFEQTGFVLENGRMLNLSQYGQNGDNHSIIEQVFDDADGVDAVNRFIQEGNVRIKATSPGIEIGTETEVSVSQLNTISRFISNSLRSKGVFYLDITDANGNEVASITYDGDSSTSDVIYDIKDYYKNGTIPDHSVRYSLSDSDGKQLTKEQSEYFKDSKMRDENGNLKVMYHGSQDAGFHVFDPSMSDDGISLFFVDRNDVASSYSGTSETYEAKTIRTAEDMNNFLAEIGYDQYEAVERNGKFELLENNEHVAWSDTAQGIYEEFCWYEGVGEGDANYKVYLNITNPLEVDAKGRPWNKIDAEFSQEVYDKYNSLTAEEKAALVDLAGWEDFRIFNSEIQEARGDALASAYAKMGENCNIYDLFSVAADNFSEEAMRENARGYLNTRDFAQRAKEGGYDGVILKNVIDNGGYSNGSEGASTVAIAFNSEQVKSVANATPTESKDIRYSLSEYTAEEKKAHNDAVVNHFGKTYSWAETGYLLLDGTRLDLSGKHDGAPGGYRTVDHRDITEALGYDYGGGDYSGSLVQFMSEGNIRIIPECNGINLSVKPTQAQEQALSNYISRFRGEVMLDIDDLNGNTVVSVEYPYGTNYTKVLNDIREWFDNGKKPENAGSYSLTKEGDTPKQYGKWNIRGEDVKLENAPTQEDIAPTPEKVDNPVDNSFDETADYAEDRAPSLSEIYGEDYAPIEHSSMYEAEVKGVQDEMNRLAKEASRLYSEGRADEAQAIIERMQELNESSKDARNKFYALQSQERTNAEGYLNSLTDADAPAEVDATYNMPRGNITLTDKVVKDVTKQVRDMLYLDAEDSLKMEKTIQRYAQNENMSESELFEEIRKNFLFYEEMPNDEDTLSAAKKHIRGVKIYVPEQIKGDFNGKRKDGFDAFRKENFGRFTIKTKNSSGALKIDQLYQELNELYPGYFPDDIWNAAEQLQQIADVMASEPETNYRSGPFDNETIQNVCDVINNGIREYSNAEIQKQLDIDRNSFYESVGVDEDIAPTYYDTGRQNQIPGQQTLFEDAPTDETVETKEETKEEPKIAQVLESTPKTPKKGNLANKVRNLVFDKQSSIEDIALKTHNRELMGKADFMLRSESRAQRHIKNKLMPILERVEETGNRQAYEEYVYHLHNIDRMSLEGKAQSRVTELEGKFQSLKPEQIKAIAAKEITDKTTERTAATIREAQEYLNALEVKNKPVFGDEITADVSREFVKNFEAEHTDAREISEAITEYNNELRQMLVDSGIISQETADLWAEMYPHYAPIRRAGKDGSAVKVPLDSMRTGVNAPIARATGGNTDMESLLDVMGSRTEQVYRAIARNNFGLELMHTLDTVTDTQSASVDEILDTFDNNYDELLKKGENGANPTFTVFEDGKRVTFDITEELYDALKPTNDVLKADVPVLSHLTKFQRGILTQYNPTFIATNAVKDIQDVLVNSQHAGKTYANVPLAIKELFTGNGKWITEYLDNGGEDLTYFDSKKQVFKKEDGAVKKVLGFVPDAIAKANDFVEKIPRLAEYIASRKNGASIEVAMLDAARVTTNFAAGGDLTKFVNKNGFTFLNASVQGFNQQIRNVREAKANGLKGVMTLAAKYAVAGLPLLLLNGLLWDDDEDYEELSDYVKDNYYIVAKYGDGKFVRIPKGRAVSVIQNAFEQMKNLITGDDEVDLARFGELVVNNLAPNNPLENNVFAPIGDVIDNKTWYGDDLVPTRLQDLPAEEQYDETTDSISKWLGEITNTSPYKWNYILDQYSGGVGDVLLPMITPESDGSGIIAPFKDKFTTDSVMKNQNVSDFYETVDELTKNANSMNATDEDVLKSKYMNSINTELGELYAQKREIQNDASLTDSEKDSAVRDVQKKIDALAKESLNTYNDVTIDGPYATVGNLHYRWYEPSADSEAEAGWQKITDKQLEKQEKVTKGLGISASDYWGNKEEYDYAYENPGKYAVAKSVGGYEAYKGYSSELYDIKADKDEDGKSITGSRKEKVVNYINNLDADYGTKIILFKSEYNADDTYNYEIIDYLNSRDDISYKEMEAILIELGFTVDSKGNITWD